MTSKVRIMGILNVTPDSFYDGGKYNSLDSALFRAEEMLRDGADIIDVGGESTRPGSDEVSEDDERARVLPVVEKIVSELGAFVSIDTMKSKIADEALAAGARMINDVSGYEYSHDMPSVAAKHNAALVIMHMKGKPKTMQDNPVYVNLIEDICAFLSRKAESAIEVGVKKENIILDPGIGFGKTLEDNYRIIYNVDSFKKLGYDLLIALSRKSLIGGLYNCPEDRLPATIALNSVAVLGGADIIRVHDVKAHRLALSAVEMLGKVC